MLPAIVHRYTFPFREAMAALLGEDQVDAETYELRINDEKTAVIVDLVNPVSVRPPDAGAEPRPITEDGATPRVRRPMRYYHHPESQSFWATRDEEDLAEGHSVELTFKEWTKRKEEHERAVGASKREEGPASVHQQNDGAEVGSGDEPQGGNEGGDLVKETGEPLKGGDLARRAAMLCDKPGFPVFMDCRTKEEAVDELRAACQIESRAELDHNQVAAASFREIERRFGLWTQGHDV